MTEQQLKKISGGYQEPPQDFSNNYYCTIVNPFYIQLVNGVFDAKN